MKLKDLEPGSKILFGKYQVENETPEKIQWIKGDNNHYKDGYCPFITEYIIDLRAFDAAEPNNPDTLRKGMGNNDYQYSSIDQWLNSDKINWFTKRHEYDQAPDNINTNYNTGYSDKPGFLYHFTDQEKKIIESVIIRCAVPYYTGQNPNLYNDLERKIFLLSVYEISEYTDPYLVNEGKIYEGLFSRANSSSRICQLSKQAFINTKSSNKPTNLDDECRYFTRSPARDYSYQTNTVYGNGYPQNSYRCSDGDAGIRPALNLPNNIEVIPSIEQEGYYEIVPPKKYILYNKGVGK